MLAPVGRERSTHVGYRACFQVSDFRFGVWGLGFEVWEFGVWGLFAFGLGFGVPDFGMKVYGLGFRVRVWGEGCGAQG